MPHDKCKHLQIDSMYKIRPFLFLNIHGYRIMEVKSGASSILQRET